jgi:O-antigen/teichoic acid export membrane protein
VSLQSHRHRHAAFARLFGSAVLSQALLSAASFSIGLILIRRSSDLQYGSFVLASSAIALLVSLQNAFFGPALAHRINQLDLRGRSELVGGLYREQNRILSVLCAAAIATLLGLWLGGVLESPTAALWLVTAVGAAAVLHREYFRLVLFAHRRPLDVLRTDLFYVALMVAGVWLATLTPMPAVATVASLGIAAAASWLLLSRALRRHEAWRSDGAPGILRQIAPLAAWAIAGAAINWSFSQGYVYLVAGALDVATVAAIAATRLLMMPMNLVATGIGSLMLPLASGWLQRHGAALLFRRLGLFALGLGATTLAYFAVLWFSRDWIFAVVFKKQFAQRDELLLLWGVVVLVAMVRSQFGYLLAAQGRFRVMSVLTLASAAASLGTSYWAMLNLGAVGALVGLLVGEAISLIGVAGLAWRAAHPPDGRCRTPPGMAAASCADDRNSP